MRCATNWTAVMALLATVLLPTVTGCIEVTGAVNGTTYIQIREGDNVTITGTVDYSNCKPVTEHHEIFMWHFQNVLTRKYVEFILHSYSNPNPSRKVPTYDFYADDPTPPLHHFYLKLFNVNRNLRFMIFRPGVHFESTSKKDEMAKSVVMVEILPKDDDRDVTTDIPKGFGTTDSAKDGFTSSSTQTSDGHFSSPVATTQGNTDQPIKMTDEPLPGNTAAQKGSTSITYVAVAVCSVVFGAIIMAAVAFAIYKIRATCSKIGSIEEGQHVQSLMSDKSDSNSSLTLPSQEGSTSIENKNTRPSEGGNLESEVPSHEEHSPHQTDTKQ